MKKGIALILFFALIFSGVLVVFGEEEETRRIYGENRYQTAVEISKSHWETSEVVVLARGDGYADSLAGVPLAYAYDAPVLLTPTNRLHSETYEEIKRLGAKKIIILGGPGAVSEDVEKRLTEEDLSIERISGDNRYSTATEIAYRLKEVLKVESFDQALVVYGQNFPDALAAASQAARLQIPILLSNGRKVSDNEKQAIDDLGIDEILIIGGEAVIAKEVQEDLEAKRIFGSNRYETALMVAKELNPLGEKVYIATGEDFADAVTGAVITAKNGGNLLLVGRDSMTDAAEAYLKEHKAEVTILGGEGVVSRKIAETVASIGEIGEEDQDLEEDREVKEWIPIGEGGVVFGSTPFNLEERGLATSYGEWIYYVDAAGGEEFYLRKMRIDGREDQLITEVVKTHEHPGTVHSKPKIQAVNDWIYFNQWGVLKRVHVDRLDEVETVTDSMREFILTNYGVFVIRENHLEILDFDNRCKRLMEAPKKIIGFEGETIYLFDYEKRAYYSLNIMDLAYEVILEFDHLHELYEVHYHRDGPRYANFHKGKMYFVIGYREGSTLNHDYFQYGVNSIDLRTGETDFYGNYSLYNYRIVGNELQVLDRRIYIVDGEVLGASYELMGRDLTTGVERSIFLTPKGSIEDYFNRRKRALFDGQFLYYYTGSQHLTRFTY